MSSESPPTTIDSLPDEVLCRIMELVRSSDADYYDCMRESSNLFDAALVCRRWREPAQCALFADVRLWVQEDEEKATGFLASPAMGRYPISSLEITRKGRGRRPPAPPFHSSLDARTWSTLKLDPAKILQRLLPTSSSTPSTPSPSLHPSPTSSSSTGKTT